MIGAMVALKRNPSMKIWIVDIDVHVDIYPYTHRHTPGTQKNMSVHGDYLLFAWACSKTE